MADTTEQARELSAALRAMRGPWLGDGHRKIHAPDAADTIDALAAKLEQAREALLSCARQAEALKRECGSADPESPQAIRNGRYQAISTTAHIALERTDKEDLTHGMPKVRLHDHLPLLRWRRRCWTGRRRRP